MSETAVVPSGFVASVKQILRRANEEMIVGLPSYFTPERKVAMADRIRRVLATLAGQKSLDKVSIESFGKAAIRVAEIGLDPDPVFGQVYLVPFNNQLQVMVGYRGYLELAWRSGKVRDVRAEVVWEEDEFVWTTGSKVNLFHKPNLRIAHDPKDRPVAAYAVADLADGGQASIVLPQYKIDQYMSRSNAVRSAAHWNAKKRPGEKLIETPWDTDYESMAKKTAIRRLVPYIPQAADYFVGALKRDEDSDEKERPAVDVAFEERTEEEPVVVEVVQQTLRWSDFSEQDQNRLAYCLKYSEAAANKAAATDWLAHFRGSPADALAAAQALLDSKNKQDGEAKTE